MSAPFLFIALHAVVALAAAELFTAFDDDAGPEGEEGGVGELTDGTIVADSKLDAGSDTGESGGGEPRRDELKGTKLKRKEKTDYLLQLDDKLRAWAKKVETEK
ncbi:hypothetical protein JCM21900_006338 [Sporobolomyces salmonicolor]